MRGVPLWTSLHFLLGLLFPWCPTGSLSWEPSSGTTWFLPEYESFLEVKSVDHTNEPSLRWCLWSFTTVQHDFQDCFGILDFTFMRAGTLLFLPNVVPSYLCVFCVQLCLLTVMNGLINVAEQVCLEVYESSERIM